MDKLGDNAGTSFKVIGALLRLSLQFPRIGRRIEGTYNQSESVAGEAEEPTLPNVPSPSSSGNAVPDNPDRVNGIPETRQPEMPPEFADEEGNSKPPDKGNMKIFWILLTIFKACNEARGQ